MKKLNVFITIALLVVLLVPAGGVFAAKGGGGKGPETDSPNGVYIVEMVNAPVVAYQGNIDGYKATKPKRNQKIDPNDADVQNYVSYLVGKHDEALDKVGGGQKLYDYVYSYNGFAAKLSLEQANKMAAVEGVLAVMVMNY